MLISQNATGANSIGCHEYGILDLNYIEAWTNGNHAKVIEYRQKIELHKKVCPVCANPAGLANSLWPDQEVIIVDPAPA